MSEPLIDVVVVSYNSRDRLRDCIERLSTERWIRVLVVDNASTDGTPGTVADLTVDLIQLEENRGFGSGCNVGWLAGSAPHVLFLNPDARISSTDVRRLSGALDRTAAGAVAPRVREESGLLAPSLRRFPRVISIFGQAIFAHRFVPNAGWVDDVIRDPRRYEREGPCDWASGACLLVRRSSLEAIGGFDEGFFMYCEDVDLCRRLWNRGDSIVYTPEVVCIHAGGASAPRWSLVGTLAESRIRYASKHFGRARANAYRVGVAFNAVTHLVVGRGFRMRVGHAEAFRVAFRGRSRNVAVVPEHVGSDGSAR
jgi:GT2 family glycosyltransferase